MKSLRFELSAVDSLQAQARSEAWECCAMGLAYPVDVQESGSERFVVRDLQPVPDTEYAVRSSTRAALKPNYLVEMTNRARRARAGLVFVHTHVGPKAQCTYSVIDDAGELELATYLAHRLSGVEHFSALVTADTFAARELGRDRPVDARAVGPIIREARTGAVPLETRFERQVRLFGNTGQAALENLRVGIVGLGGTGSLIAQQLAHLGIGRFVLIDPDRIEATNLNRVVGARPADIGELKVAVAECMIRAINPGASCEAHAVDVVDDGSARLLSSVDFLFGCTDSMASRALMNQFAYQNLVPCIDMGVAIHSRDGRVEYIAGRTQMLSPGLPCLVCTDKLDPEQVRREMLTPEQRAADPYIVGEHVEQPAVISLNSIVTAAAITMFLAAATGVPSEARLLHYDGVRGTLRAATMEPRPTCIVCSPSGALGRGSSWQLPVRRATT